MSEPKPTSKEKKNKNSTEKNQDGGENDLTASYLIKESFKTFKKTWLLTLITLILISVILASFAILIAPNLSWQVYSMQDDVTEVLEWIQQHPDEVMPQEYAAIQQAYTVLTVKNLLVHSAFYLSPIIMMLMFLPPRIYYIYTHNEDGAKSLLSSFKYPFKNLKMTLTALFMLLLYPYILSIGIMMAYIPGFLFMVYFFYSFESLTLDEKHGMEVLRGGIYYARGNFKKTSLIFVVGLIIPLVISYLYMAPLLRAMHFSPEDIIPLMDPENRDYKILFIYYFVNIFFQNLPYIWLPVGHTISFVKFRDERLKALMELEESGDNAAKVDVSSDIITVTIKAGDKYYHCANCGKKLPIGAYRCNSCGQLHKIRISKT